MKKYPSLRAFRWWLLPTLAVLLLSGRGASAHNLEQGYIYLDLNQPVLEGRYELTVADMNRALGLGLPTDGTVQESDLIVHSGRIHDYLQGRIRLAPGGQPAVLDMESLDLLSLRKAQYVQVPFTTQTAIADIEKIEVEYQVLFDVDPAHRGFLIIENDWKTGTFDNEGGISLVFSPDQPGQILDLGSSSAMGGFMAMVRLGVHHIWDGIDHLLFLLALLIPAVMHRVDGKWQPVDDFGSALIHVVKIVTLFTVAHTITLSVATLGAIDLSPRLVESVIAISIAIAALDILWPVFRRGIWWVVFAFGLFHGFGFASVLSSIGIPPQYTTPSLLAFNLGVELGQLAIVAVVFSLLYLVRRVAIYRPLMMQCGATVLILVSLYWFCERAFLIDLPAGELLNSAMASLGLRDA